MKLLSDFFNKKSILSIWGLSYAVVILIPVTICVIFYFSIANVLQEEIVKNNERSLSLIQSQLDHILLDMNEAGYDLSVDSPIIKYISNHTPPVSESLAIIERLSEINTDNLDVFIFSFVNNTITSPQSANSADSYYNSHFSKSPLSFDDWRASLLAISSSSYCTLNSASDGREILCYTIPVFNNSTSPIGVIGVTFMVSDFFKTNAWFDNSIYIISNFNNTIISSHSAIPTEVLPDVSEFRFKGSKLINIDGQAFYVSSSPSSSNYWHYVAITSESKLLQKLLSVRITLTVLILICILICVIIVFSLTKLNYKPVKNLLSLVNAQDNSGNEFDAIQNAIINIQHHSSDMQHTLSSHERLVHEYAFSRILRNEFKTGANFKEAADIFSQVYNLGNYSLVLFDIHLYENLFSGQNNDLTQEQLYEQATFIITNIYEELLSDCGRILCVKIDRYIVMLINMEDSSVSGFKEKCKKILCDGIDIISQNFKITFSAVTDYGICNRLSDLHSMYQHLARIVEKSTKYDRSVIIDAQSLTGSNSSAPHYYSSSVEEHFIHAVEEGNLDVAISVIDDVFKKNEYNKSISPDASSALMFDVTETLSKLYRRLISHSNSPGFNDELLISRLLDCSEPKTFLAEIKSQLQNLIELCSPDNDANLKDSIINYIELNYNDSNLSLAQISDHLNMHYVYVSQTFKEQTGMGLLQYIHDFRTKKSLSMLSDTDKSIGEIASYVGYSNSQTYIRNFKKIIGISPTQYRAEHSKT